MSSHSRVSQAERLACRAARASERRCISLLTNLCGYTNPDVGYLLRAGAQRPVPGGAVLIQKAAAIRLQLAYGWLAVGPAATWGDALGESCMPCPPALRRSSRRPDSVVAGVAASLAGSRDRLRGDAADLAARRRGCHLRPGGDPSSGVQSVMSAASVESCASGGGHEASVQVSRPAVSGSESPADRAARLRARGVLVVGCGPVK